MAYLLRLVCFSSTKVFFSKKIFIKLEYLIRTLIRALFYLKAAIWIFCISIFNSGIFIIAICIIKVSEFLSNSILANFFLLKNFTYLMVDRVLTAI